MGMTMDTVTKYKPLGLLLLALAKFDTVKADF